MRPKDKEVIRKTRQTNRVGEMAKRKIKSIVALLHAEEEKNERLLKLRGEIEDLKVTIKATEQALDASKEKLESLNSRNTS